ncbi:pentatricopeptide repeat protein [Metarhizium rileyi]|uniref:Pentatricopeptide repeat protein n=1 Tax=Metarhizium rileyi (strain RCEF 4871) TaxID=1649241 RepID=A0A167D9L6_METRR|nr:pentatricopeptide repeat protein [Metarhizium rileyi RCEF 4871]
MRSACLSRVRCARLSTTTRPQPNVQAALDKTQRRPLSNGSQRLLPSVKSSELSSRIQPNGLPNNEWRAALAKWSNEPSKELTAPRWKDSDATSDRTSTDSVKCTPGSSARWRRSSPEGPARNGRTWRFRTRFANPSISTRRKPDLQITPSVRRVARRGRDVYFQWGYLRHQASGSEFLAMRKTFNSWKKKFGNVAGNRNPDWPWKDVGERLLEHDTVASMRLAWNGLTTESREKHWLRTMLSVMRLRPEKTAMVLEATLDPWPCGYAINDVLLFMVKRLDLTKAKNIHERTLKAKEILGFLQRLIVESPKGHIPFTQRVLGLFAKQLPSEQASELYSLLRRSGFELHANTMVQFASKLAGDPAYKETAFRILQTLSDSGADLNEARPSSVITSLLHCKVPEGVEPEQNHTFSPKDALEYFIERGFNLNLLSATAFLDTLSQQGEVDEAIRLALLFAETGIQLDHKAWATVFRGAKVTRNVETIAKALDVAKVANVQFVDVLNNALHSAFYFAEVEVAERKHQVSSRPALFGSLLRIYAKKFDLEPLQWWLPDSLPLLLAQGTGQQSLVPDIRSRTRWDFEATIIPFVNQLFSSGDDTKLPPNSTTIAIMMRAYIRSLQQPYDLMAYYRFFKSRLEEQSKDDTLPSASRLIKNQGSLIHDTLIFAMTEHDELSQPALQVFGDMLRNQQLTNNADGAKAQVEGDGVVAPASTHPAPTVLTFTILLRGLMNHRDRFLAEQVIEIMRENGIQPNIVTWNTLTSRYATMQDVPKTVSTLQDMEAAGLKPDIYTLRAFGKLRNQERALQMMEDMIEVNRRNMAQEELYE